jgi:peptidyl-prolyl cis-trans isomerase B (cyclophilin B)
MKNNIQILCSVLAVMFFLAGCSDSGEDAQVSHEPNEPAKEDNMMIVMKTTKGDIQLELDAKNAPNTVANFMSYVENGHYNGTVFHRVISDFMIQGGGFTADMKQKPAPDTVDNEANNGLKNELGTIAMARTMDPHSASAQFFINTKDNGFLDFTAPTAQGWGYCVFGKVVDGMDVVKAIEKVATGRQGAHSDVPLEPVAITEVTVVE